MKITVQCEAGHRGEDEPRVVHLGEHRVEVGEILDRWLSADHAYFKLRGGDGSIYIVRHDAATQEWELISFSR